MYYRSLVTSPFVALLFAALVLTIQSAAAVQIYYTVGGDIIRADSDTFQFSTIYSGPSDGRPMVPFVHEDSLYWSTFHPGQLRSSDLEGNGVTTLVDQGDTTTRAIQFHNGKIYWANETLGGIYRSDLDGTGVENVISGYFGHEDGIWDFEIYNERFYWVGWDTAKISSTALDGSDFQSYSPGLTRAFSLEIAGDRMYISDNQNAGAGRIVSIAMDGSDLMTIANDQRPLSIALYGDRVYYNDSESHQISSVALLGGTSRVEIVTLESGVSFQLTVIPEPSRAVLLFVGTAFAVACASRRRRLFV